MYGFTSKAALTLTMVTLLLGGCEVPEHRMNVAASQDDIRRSDFEHCRAEGRTDCDAILNAPVNSDTRDRDTVRDQERRAAYDRCVERGGHDCDDLLRR